MAIEARDRPLPDWFTRIRTRQTALPRFQRFEAWGHATVTQLFNTILQDLPVGALLVLEIGNEEPFISRPLKGVPATGERVTEHLLDGQQRLTALWRGLHNNYDDRTYFLYLTEDEEARLLAFCGPQLRPLVITALHTGFRASELRSLTWTDVEINRRMITVRAGYAKNGEARRVPMNQLLTDILKSVKLANNQGDRVFCNRDGTSYRSFRSAFERAVRKAAIVDCTFHDLRHMFASRLVMAGVDLPTVKELLGHRDISMTMRYTHLSSDHKQTAVGKLEQFAAKVSVIFTTPSTRPSHDRSQVTEKSHAPVAQPG